MLFIFKKNMTELNDYRSNNSNLLMTGQVIYSRRLKIKLREPSTTWALFSSSSVISSHCVYL